MKQLQKVVWHEGMILKPHHFQQAERCRQLALHARIRSVARHDWGLSEIQIDKEAVANGQFVLLRCAGVMPDGLPFNMPDIHPLPQSRSFEEHFEPKYEELGVFLTLPLELPGGPNCQLDDLAEQPDTRFYLKNIALPDDNSGENEQEIGIGLPNFQIRFGDVPPPGFGGIRIAQIVRQENNTYALQEKFIPPCLHLQASEPLCNILRRLLGALVEKNATLRERRQREASGQIEFTNVDVKTFWLLHTVSGFIPLLSHLEGLKAPGCHPEELYTRLLALAGQLTTFSPNSDMKFPQYEHDRLHLCFHSLYENIRKLLDLAVPPPNYVRIPLGSKDGSLYSGRIVDEALFRTAQFYLVMRGEFDERQVADEMPRHIKISSPEEIHSLAQSAVQGVKISSISRPPVGPPSGPGLLYFRLDKSGIYWDNIRKSSAIAILFTATFKKLKPMLLAVTEER